MDEREIKWAQKLRELDVSEEDIARVIQESRREYAAIAAGKCPQCGEPIRRTLSSNPNRSELCREEFGPGAWVSYRCSTQPPIGQLRPLGVCDYMLDRWEAQGAN